MARKQMVTIAEAELYLKVFEDDLRRAKQKLLQMEFQIPDLSEDHRRILSQMIRESMIELAKERLPTELREGIPAQLANRVDELFKLWEPNEQ